MSRAPVPEADPAGASAEQRFAHLLKPIRDLAKNWSIDVATELEEYLEELDSVTISLDGKTHLNFAEAALLIQGSTCIYSKKVEFLYALVLQTLEHVTQQKQQRLQAATAAADGDEADPDVDPALLDEDEEFLTLDDVEEGRNIDLDDGGDEFQPKAGGPPQTPVLMLSGIFGSDLGDSFRLTGLDVHKSGALLMDGVAHTSLDGNLVSTAASADFGAEDWAPVDDDDDDDGPVFDDDGGFELAGPAEEDMLEPPARSAAAPANFNASASASGDLSQVWAPLDPHAEGPKAKPLRVARTFVLPAELRENAKEPEAEAEAQPEQQRTTTRVQPPATAALRGLSSGEFSYVVRHQKKVQLKRRLAMKRATAAAAMSMAAAAPAAAEDEDAFGAMDDWAPAAAEDDASDGDDDGDAPVFADDDAPFDLPPVSPVRPLALDDAFGGAGGAGDDEGAPKSYEDLCRRHVTEYLRGAEVYAQETQLSRRVADWQARLAPTLEEQDARPAFDIHEYGDRIVHRLEAEAALPAGPKSRKRAASGTKLLGFEAIAGGADSFEVARLFLASLQLANAGNVRLAHSHGRESDDLTLTLQSNERQNISEYLAPSLLSQGTPMVA